MKKKCQYSKIPALILSHSVIKQVLHQHHLIVKLEPSLLTPFLIMCDLTWYQVIYSQLGSRQTFAVKQSYSQLTLNQHIASNILNCLQISKQTCRGKKFLKLVKNQLGQLALNRKLWTDAQFVF